MEIKLKSKNDLSKLPRYVLLDIIYFVPWQEIILSVSHVNSQLFKLFHNLEFLKFYLNKCVIFQNVQINQQIQTLTLKDILKFLIINKNQQYEELPFWGHKTDAGIYQNIFNYWIDKAFSKSLNQMVSYKKQNNVHIEGTLAQDIVDFKSIMVQMAEKLNSYYKYYNLNLKTFPTKFSKINIDKVFYQYYESSQHSTYLEESGKRFWNHFLLYDAQLEHAIEYNDTFISQFYREIKFTLASVHKIHISRKGSFTKPAKTIVIYYKDKEDQGNKKLNQSHINTNYISLFDNCNSYGQLKLILYQNKNIAPKISKDSAGKGYHYVIFERNQTEIVDNYYPILWVQFLDNHTTEFKYNFNLNQIFLANKMLIKVINHSTDDIDLCGNAYDQTFQEPLHGPGFSFINFKGVCMNLKSLTKKKKIVSKQRPKSKIRYKTSLIN